MKLLMIMLVLFANNVFAIDQSAKTLTITQSWSKDGIYANRGVVSAPAPVNGVISENNTNPFDVSGLMNSQRQNYSGMADDQVRNSFTTYANRFFDTITPQIASLMQNGNIQSATVKFDQQFQQGTILKRVINTTLVRVLANGQLQIVRLGTRILRDPIILKATYVSKAVSAEVPPQFAYANAGKIVYRLYDKNNSPLTNELVVDVNGAYDQIDSSSVTPSNRAINTSWMPECLMSSEWANYTHAQQGVTLDGVHPFTCPVATDLKTLAAQHDATDIKLDYSQRLSMIYDKKDPNCSANCDAEARILVNVDSRVITTKKYIFFIAPYGKPTFTVSGNIGYGMQSDTMQYYAKTESISLMKDVTSGAVLGAGQGLTALNNVMTQINSPAQAFTKTVEITDSGARAAYQNLIINPFTTNDPGMDLLIYDWRNDVVNGLSTSHYCYAGQCGTIAPITGGI